MFVNILFFIIFPFLALLALVFMGASAPVFGRLIMSSTGLFTLLLAVMLSDTDGWPDSRWGLYLYFGVMGAACTYGLMFLWQTLRRFGLPLLDSWIGFKVGTWAALAMFGIDYERASRFSEALVILALSMVGLALSLSFTHHMRPALSLGEEPVGKA